MKYFLTCDECDYYSMECESLEEIKTMEYPKYDYSRNGFYHIEIGVMKRGKYNKLGKATVLINNCRCVKAEIRITL